MGLYGIIFIGVLILVLVEMRLSAKWSPFYFNRGIKLFDREVISRGIEEIQDSTIISLNDSFKRSWWSSSLVFRRLTESSIAFREKLFEFSLMNYTPLMHGKIIVDAQNDKVRVVGLSNWFPILFLVLWYSPLFRGFDFERDFVFLVAPVGIFGAIYLTQAVRYNKVCRYFAGEHGKTGESTSTLLTN